MILKLFGRGIEIRRATEAPMIENATEAQALQGIGNDSGWLEYLGAHGYNVDSMTAIKVAAVYRCVDLLSKTIASMPLHMLEEAENGKMRAKRHGLYNMMLALPNKNTTAFEFWQCFVANMLLTRGGFAKIERDVYGRIVGLWNIPTQYVSYIGINRVNGERYIDVTCEGKMETLRSGEFLYVPNFRYSNDAKPEDPMRIAEDVIGIARDQISYASVTFKQGMNPGGFVEYPNGLSEPAYERMKRDFAREYAGVKNAGKLMLLEEGGKAQLFTRDMEKTQVLECRKFAVSEICRIFGVPPHLCMDMEHATFSNIEQQSLEFVRDAVNPMSVRIEQALFRDLLTERERKKYYFKFNTNGLLRGDTAARTAYYSTMRQNGIMSADEIRALEDMNALPEGRGETVYINGNMLPLSTAQYNAPKSMREGGSK